MEKLKWVGKAQARTFSQVLLTAREMARFFFFFLDNCHRFNAELNGGRVNTELVHARTPLKQQCVSEPHRGVDKSCQ